MGVIMENNEMNQALIPLKWQPLGQGLLGTINPLCSLEQVCKRVEEDRVHALCGFFWPS